MVLTYFENRHAEPLVLDSLTIDFKYESQTTDLILVYSLSGNGLWLTKPKENKRTSDAARLSSWQNLLLKIENGD